VDRLTGVIKCNKTTFGFVKLDDTGADVYFPPGAVKRPWKMESLEAGARVTVDVDFSDARGPRAVAVWAARALDEEQDHG
jgi:cold shock CspA family protein